jgi:hypothetical protein
LPTTEERKKAELLQKSRNSSESSIDSLPDIKHPKYSIEEIPTIPTPRSSFEVGSGGTVGNGLGGWVSNFLDLFF